MQDTAQHHHTSPDAIQCHPMPLALEGNELGVSAAEGIEQSCGKIEGDPGASGNSQPGSDQHPFATEGDGVASPILEPDTDTTRDELRDHAISLLDAVRHQYEASRINRIRYIHLARRYGLTNADIGEVLGITEAGVRMAIKRAADNSPPCHGELLPQYYCAECGTYNADEGD